MVVIEQALTEKQIRHAIKLFIEYSNLLGVDLSFQKNVIFLEETKPYIL